LTDWPCHLTIRWNDQVKSSSRLNANVRFCSVRTAAGPKVAVATDDGIRPVTPRVASLASMFDELTGGGAPGLEEALPAPELGPPLRPGKLVAIGLNYPMHADESAMAAPERPLVFAKFPSSVSGPSDPIVIDRALTQRVDWEVELAVVIGRRMRAVPRESALDHVFGYTVANDVSARDVQFGDGQWTRGKSFDTFCPLGPVVVTADELGPPDGLRLTTRVNGELMQDDSTSSMIFGVADLLAYCSRSFTLEPGDVLLSGTPHGCGEFMDPPRSLAPGDVVEVAIEGIGSLRNPVVAVDGAPSGPTT
jgi:2-keto-4-pentenoate hydratase/2-oxohepta-3-ene-1,7-dioic acid hydratase in catechol pathway